jgi:hypothetical protein
VAIQLSDIKAAVLSYMENTLDVNVSGVVPATGAEVNPGETFSFTVTISNPQENGVATTVTSYDFSVRDADARLVVPGGGLANDEDGNVLLAGSEVRYFNFRPSPQPTLGVGGGISRTLTGRALLGTGSSFGSVRVRVFGRPDLNDLFRQMPTPNVASALNIIDA